MKRFIAALVLVSISAASVSAADSEPDQGLFGVFGEVFDHAGQTAEDLLENASSAAGKLADDVASTSKDLSKKANEMADQAVSALGGAVDVVVDQAGNLRNLAVESAGKTAASAVEAYTIIRDQGEEMMDLVKEEVGEMDFTDPENNEKAMAAIDKALESAYDAGFFGDSVDKAAIDIISDVIFGVNVYTYQYAKGTITLPEYAAVMSEMIIRKGLPTGVGFIADRLPIPGAGSVAKEVTALIITAAYGLNEEEILESAG